LDFFLFGLLLNWIHAVSYDERYPAREPVMLVDVALGTFFQLMPKSKDQTGCQSNGYHQRH